MNRLLLLILFLISAVSCSNRSGKSADSFPTKDSVVLHTPIDTLALTLDALQNKRLPEGYKTIGEIRTAVLTYTAFRMGDVVYYVFSNETGDEISFSGNDSHFPLTVKSPNPNDENGGKDPNSRYLNKTFRVVWRRLQLDHKPQTETELYYQQYDEIIYLKEMKTSVK